MGQGRVPTHHWAPIQQFRTLFIDTSSSLQLFSALGLEVRTLHVSAQSPTDCATTKSKCCGGTTLPIYPWNTWATSQSCWRRCWERIPCSTVWMTGKQNGSHPHSSTWTRPADSMLNSGCVDRNETGEQKKDVSSVRNDCRPQHFSALIRHINEKNLPHTSAKMVF